LFDYTQIVSDVIVARQTMVELVC